MTANTRQLVNTAEVCRLTKIDRTTLAKYFRDANLEPVDPFAKQGAKNFYLDEVLSVLVRSFKVRAEDSSKARKEAADADKAEITVAKLRGDLISVGAVRNSAADLVKSLYQRLVMLSPRLLSDQLTGNPDRAEVEIAIREHNAKIFDELRSLPNNFLQIPVETEIPDVGPNESEATLNLG